MRSATSVHKFETVPETTLAGLSPKQALSRLPPKPIALHRSTSGFHPRPRAMSFLKFDDPRISEDKLVEIKK